MFFVLSNFSVVGSRFCVANVGHNKHRSVILRSKYYTANYALRTKLHTKLHSKLHSYVVLRPKLHSKLHSYVL